MDPLMMGLVMFTLLAVAVNVGVRIAQRRNAEAELAHRRSRTIPTPAHFTHMASRSMPALVERLCVEAHGIVAGKLQGTVTRDHVGALLVAHQDAVDQYDRLGDFGIGQREAIKRLERDRQQLLSAIARHFRCGATVEDAMVMLNMPRPGAEPTPIRAVLVAGHIRTAQQS